MGLREKKSLLVNAVSNMAEVRAIGQTGDVNEIPLPGKGDIDLFVLCDEIPSETARRAAYDACKDAYSEYQMTICTGGHWGTEDALVVDGVDVFFMYFTVAEMSGYIDGALAGKYPEKEEGFYPTGRLAAVQSMNVLYDEGETLVALKDRVFEYPEALSKALFDHHYARITTRRTWSARFRGRTCCSITWFSRNRSTIFCRRCTRSTGSISPAGSGRSSTWPRLSGNRRTAMLASCASLRTAVRPGASLTRQRNGLNW